MAGAAAAGGRLNTIEPWQRANDAAREAGGELRPLTSVRDADLILRVMVETWGDHQLFPREMIVALAESGNVPWGAFEEGEIAGYVLGWAGVDRTGRQDKGDGGRRKQ